MRPLDAAAVGDYIMEPPHLAWQRRSGGRAKKPLIQARSALRGSSDRMREQRSPPISFPYRARLPSRFSTSSVIWKASRGSRAIEAVEVQAAAIGDDAPIRIG